MIDWGPGYRIYLARGRDSLIVLLVGGTKHGQSADITRARALHAEYKARKRTERRHISRTDNATSVRRKG